MTVLDYRRFFFNFILHNTLTNPDQNSLGIPDFDQESCGNLGSWILDFAKNAFRMHSSPNLRGQDSRFKIQGLEETS